MANIKISLQSAVFEGQPLTFKAPCDCSNVTGIKVEYPNGEDTAFQVFSFTDAHGNDLTGLGNLFAEGAMVKVILDTNASKAFIQNADTNAYLEKALAATAKKIIHITTAGTHVDDYTTEGIYCFPHQFTPGGAPSRSATDYDVNGWLIVLTNTNSSAVKQIWWRWGTYGLNDHQMSLRAGNGTTGNWSEWVRLVTSRDFQDYWVSLGGLTESADHPGCFYRTVGGAVEWDNPPMLPGVEYRTAERFGGKVVYCKHISHTSTENYGGYGDSPVSISIPHGISGYDSIVRVDARHQGGHLLPIITSGGGIAAVVGVTTSNIELRFSNCSFGARTWKFNLYYTK